MHKKQFMTASLFSIVLLTLAFTPTSTQVREYDPYADYNGDGKIDIKDIASTAIAYGTSGNPTRNVTVTNLPLDEEGNLKVSQNGKFISLWWMETMDSISLVSDIQNMEGFGHFSLYFVVWNFIGGQVEVDLTGVHRNPLNSSQWQKVPIESFTFTSCGEILRTYVTMISEIYVVVRAPVGTGISAYLYATVS